jgi:hypothetical protein
MLDANAVLQSWMTPSTETSSDGCVRSSAGIAKVSMGGASERCKNPSLMLHSTPKAGDCVMLAGGGRNAEIPASTELEAQRVAVAATLSAL